MMEIDLRDKNTLVLGVANDRSIAWAVAKMFYESNANVGITFGAMSNQKRVIPLSKEINATFAEMCDVTSSEDIQNLKNIIEQKFKKIDCLVHSIAFAPPEELQGNLLDVAKNGFEKTMEVSVYSLIFLLRELRQYLNPNASIIVMTNHGAQKVIEGYGLMGIAKAALENAVRYLANELGKDGIRINAISAGPIKTMSAMGVDNFDYYLELVEEKSPLHRNITTKDVAQMALFLGSDMSRNITGAINYVDSGINIMGS